MRFKAVSIPIALVLVVVAAGCGSKKSAAPAGTSGTTTATTATTATTTGGGATTVSTTSSGTPSFASAKNCAQLESVAAKFTQAIAAANKSGNSSLTDVANLYKALADAAPSAIRPDVEAIATAFANYANGLKKAGYTPGKVPTASQLATLSSLAKSFSSPKLQAAEQHLSAWGQKNCGG